jgi:hypothetical protein
MAEGCKLAECTFAETGICLENNPVDSCPNRLTVLDSEPTIDGGSIPPPLSAPPEKPRFPSSLTLGKTEANELMCNRYCRLVGILGAPDAGKTASLASLFLLLGRNKLSGYSFADSRTIMAFNEIAQGARRWNKGVPPEQMTVHTELSDDRDAGYLHLRLKRSTDGAVFDLLLPDLPGEWSTTFIDRNRADRLDFLKAADVIWIMADGRQLIAPETRITTLRRLDLLVARVAALVPTPPPVVLVLSHRDSGEPRPQDIQSLRVAAESKGVVLDVVSISSFKRKGGETAAGFGIDELIAKTIGDWPKPQPFWPVEDQSLHGRAMLRYTTAGGFQ